MDINDINKDPDTGAVTMKTSVPGQYNDADIQELLTQLKEVGIEATYHSVTPRCDTCGVRADESYPNIDTAKNALDGLGWFLAGSDLYCPACRASAGL